MAYYKYRAESHVDSEQADYMEDSTLRCEIFPPSIKDW